MRGRKRMVTGVAILLVLGLSLSAIAEDVYEEWVARYNGPANSHDGAYDLAVDDSGNVYVTGGSTWAGYSSDFITIKYSAAGETLWTNRYGNGRGLAISVDYGGNLYATGVSSNDYLTIKYTPGGDTVWTRRYSSDPFGGNDEPKALGIDDSGYILVTGDGFGDGTGLDFTTLKYTPQGDTVWLRRYNHQENSSDNVTALDVDRDGNVYVTGWTHGFGSIVDYATIKYSADGESLWAHTYSRSLDSWDIAMAITVDDSGNTYVTGRSYSDSATGWVWLTIKYATDGVIQWVRTHEGTGSSETEVHAIGLDGNGNIYVIGSSGGIGTWADITTIKYQPDGNVEWVRSYNGSNNANDFGWALFIDDSGNVYVSGYSRVSSFDDDYVTIKYSSNGDTRWIRRYGGQGKRGDWPHAISGDKMGNVYVTGSSFNNYSTIDDIATIKYSPCTSSSPKAGDANSDDSLSLADIVSMVNHIFGKNVYLPCDANLYDCWVFDRFCRYDWNGDQKITLGDCIRAINHIFNKPGGPWSPVPSLGCCPFPQNQ